MGLPFVIDDADAKTVGNKTYSETDVAQMRTMLTDPGLSSEVKNNILYGLSAMGKISDAEIEEYAPRVGADPEDVKGGGQAPGESVAKLAFVYPAAQQQLEETRAAEGAKTVESGQNSLQQGGFANSDQIIDEGAKGLVLFHDFYPLFQQAGGEEAGGINPTSAGSSGIVTAESASAGASAAAAYTHSGVDPRSLEQGMGEFRGIDFNAFRTDAQLLRGSAAAVGEATEQLGQAWATNTAGWVGDAKTAAQQNNQAIVTAAADLSQAMRTAPDTIAHTIDSCIQQNVIDFSTAVLEIYADGKIADMTPLEIHGALVVKDKIPQVLRDFDAAIQEIESQGFLEGLASFLGGLVGSLIFGPIGYFASKKGFKFASQVDSGNIKEERAKSQQLLNEAEQTLLQFTSDYVTKANSVHQQAREFIQGIQDNYSAMIEELTRGLDPDPFAVAATDGASSHGAGDRNPGGAVGPTGPSAGGTGVAPPVPTMAPPSSPNAVQSAAADIPGTNPVTGKPLEIDPESGEPFPIDPVSGEAMRAVGDDQGSLTIEHGDRTIDVVEPNSNGEMSISISDDSGASQQLRLDFGDAEEPVVTRDGAAGGGDSTASAEEVHTPGPDGKIHIEEGDLKITAEQPDGPEGPTVISLDDGSGVPTVYTMGDSPSALPGAGSGNSQGGSVDASEQATAPQAMSSRDGVANGIGGGSVPAADTAKAGQDVGAQVASVAPSRPVQAGAGLGSAPGGFAVEGHGEVSGTAAGLEMLGAGLGGDEIGEPVSAYGVADGLFDTGGTTSRISGLLDLGSTGGPSGSAR